MLKKEENLFKNEALESPHAVESTECESASEKKIRILPSFLSDKKKRTAIIAMSVSILVVLGALIGGLIYVNDYYRANNEAIAIFAERYESVNRVELDNGIAYEPSENEKQIGFIFYPGGKVEYTAYEPLMLELADEGVLCVLIEMPFNLAVLGVNSADSVFDLYPEVESWYIGGHSLGGSMAASYLASNSEKLSGLILLGSYSTDRVELPTLSIYGSNDGVMNREKYDKYKENLVSLTEFVIEGGNHAYFGMYGEQSGDGNADISVIDQTDMTATLILDFVVNK